MRLILVIIFCLLLGVDILNFILNGNLARILRTTKRHRLFKGILNFTMILIIMIVAGYYFKLNTKSILYLCIMGVVSLLLVINFNFELVRHEMEFENLSQLMLRMCVFFRIHKMTLPTIVDAKMGVDRKYQKSMDGIIVKLEQGESIHILKKLSSHYLLASMVEVFDAAERVGTQSLDHQLKRLEHDIEVWISQTKRYQEEEMQLRKRMSYLIIMSIVVAYLAQSMLMHAIDVSSDPLYQYLILGFLMGLFVLVVLMNKRSMKSWYLSEEQL
jgi:hypothetical protein